MTIQIAPPTADSDPLTEVCGTGTRFWPGFSVGLCAATMTCALLATGSLVADRVSDAPLFEIGGTVTLIDGAADSTVPGFECEGDFCTFFFTVTDVPRGASHYDVEISHRGSVSYDESAAESGVHLTLGH